MFAGKKTVIRATLAMIGTIVGAGIFGVPAMMGQVGVLAGSIIFWVIAFAVLATHLLFLELLHRDPERRRLPGYVGKVLGPWAKRGAAFVQICQLVGANFAYVLLGGEFLWVIAQRIGFASGPLVWQVVFWIGGAMTILLALRMVAKVEAALTWGLVGVLFVVILFALGSMDASRFVPQDWLAIFAPMGVFLFAMFGLTVLPEIFEIVGRDISRARTAAVIGTLASAFLTWLFGVCVMAALPAGSASDATAIAFILPSGLWWIVPLFGFLAVVTSFITAAFDMQAMMRIDFGLSRVTARILTLGLPFALLFLVARDFLKVVSTIGALFTAATALFAVIAAKRAIASDKRLPRWWRQAVPIACVIVFLAAIAQRLGVFGV